MDSRTHVLNILNYGDFNSMPVWHWGLWPETRTRWEKEGLLPADLPEHEFFQADPLPPNIPVEFGLYPPFPEEIIEETDEYKIFRQQDGVVARDWKNRSSIPHFEDYLLKDRKTWQLYKEKLQPDPGRIPSNLKEIARQRAECGKPVFINVGSMVGWIRDWMGVEALSYLCFDDPDLLQEMVDTVSDLQCWVLDQVLPHATAHIAWGWEDIAFKSGPLISPNIFKNIISKGYKKIAAKLHSYGIKYYLVDCDGMIEPLIPIWLDAGVNIMFPFEIGTWEADPFTIRKKFSRDLRIIGGFNKLVLEKDRKAIDAEIEKRKPLMADGGYIPMPDHLITPDTPMANYQYYLEKIRNLRF